MMMDFKLLLDLCNLCNKILKFHPFFIRLNGLLLSCGVFIIIGCVSTEQSPHLHIENSTWDFGVSIVGDTPTHVFKLQNTGKRILHIERIVAECACTAVLLSKKDVPSGTTGELKISLDTRDRWGALLKQVDIYSNDPVSPVTTITLKTIIYPLFTVTPEYLHFSSNGSRRVIISSRLEIGLQIRQIESPASYISAHVSGTIVENGNISHSILVNLDKDISKTLDVTENLIVHTNLENQKVIKVPIRIHLGQVVTLQPQKLFFGIVHQGDEKTRRAILSVPTGIDLHIEKVEREHQFLVPTVAHPTPDTYHINVKLDSNAPAGLFHDTIKVYTANPDLSLAIVAYGIVRK